MQFHQICWQMIKKIVTENSTHNFWDESEQPRIKMNECAAKTKLMKGLQCKTLYSFNLYSARKILF